ncbi:MAG: DUF1524 domain-containing protein [Mollicutes bacterium]|nr:MAG: DUF1524 domain-containing protein [Mollicutes bacterium]
MSEDNKFKKTKFNLEHIQPKDPSIKKNSEEIFELGNLILLEEEINNSIENLSFEEKKEKYKKSKNRDVENLIKNNVEKKE